MCESTLGYWGKEVLAARIEDDLFSNQGEIANNFTQKIPDARESLKAIGMFKDEYLLDFINVEELCERDKEDIDERVIEQEMDEMPEKLKQALPDTEELKKLL